MHLKIQLVMLLYLFISTNGLMDMDVIQSFFKAKNLTHNIILTCYKKKAQARLLRTAEKNMLISVKHIKNLNILDTLVENYRRTGVVLDGNCVETKGFLLRCGRYKVFDTKHFWLVFYNSSNYHALFRHANLNIDADVKVVYPDTSDVSNNTFLIDDVYNPAFGKGGEFKSSNVGFYEPDRGYHINVMENKYVVRKNLTGVQFKVVVVLPEPFEGSLDDYLVNDRDIRINTFNRFHSRLMHYCKDYHNFSMEIAVDRSWGFLQTDGTMDGLVGGLEKKTTDFGLSPLFVKKDRAQFITYGRKTWNLRAAFILRNPKSRKSYQIFIKPLSVQVWICIILTSIISVFSQKMGYKLEEQVDKKYFKRANVDASWSFSTVCTFGAFCQQGIAAFPSSLSGRIAALVTLLLGMLIYQFYSASLVSFLLNVPTTVINTVQDILDNDFKIGCEDVRYSTEILKYATDDITREVYRRLLVMSNNQTGFLKPEVGLNLVKKGEYAFHVELVTGYSIIEQEFDESMICELREVSLLPLTQMHANYQKGSHFKDVMDVCLHRLSENGAVAREILFWHPRKPACMRSATTVNINTGLLDFYPALVVLILGMILSLEILIIEILFYHRNLRKKLDIQKTLFPYMN